MWPSNTTYVKQLYGVAYSFIDSELEHQIIFFTFDEAEREIRSLQRKNLNIKSIKLFSYEIPMTLLNIKEIELENK